MKPPRRYAPMGGSLAPVRVAGFRWNRWQPSAVYATRRCFTGFQQMIVKTRHVMHKPQRHATVYFRLKLQQDA